MSAARLTKPNHQTTCQALSGGGVGTQSQPDFLKNQSAAGHADHQRERERVAEVQRSSGMCSKFMP